MRDVLGYAVQGMLLTLGFIGICGVVVLLCENIALAKYILAFLLMSAVVGFLVWSVDNRNGQ